MLVFSWCHSVIAGGREKLVSFTGYLNPFSCRFCEKTVLSSSNAALSHDGKQLIYAETFINAMRCLMKDKYFLQKCVQYNISTTNLTWFSHVFLSLKNSRHVCIDFEVILTVIISVFYNNKSMYTDEVTCILLGFNAITNDLCLREQ